MKKKSTGKQILNLFIAIAVLGAVVYFSIQSGVFKKPSTTNTVRMEVDCSGGYAIITYAAGDIDSNGAVTVSTPWKKTFIVEDGESVFLTAGNPAQTGKVSCTIDLNGNDWKLDKVSYPKEVVACAGIIPHK